MACCLKFSCSFRGERQAWKQAHQKEKRLQESARKRQAYDTMKSQRGGETMVKRPNEVNNALRVHLSRRFAHQASNPHTERVNCTRQLTLFPLCAVSTPVQLSTNSSTSLFPSSPPPLPALFILMATQQFTRL